MCLLKSHGTFNRLHEYRELVEHSNVASLPELASAFDESPNDVVWGHIESERP